MEPAAADHPQLSGKKEGGAVHKKWLGLVLIAFAVVAAAILAWTAFGEGADATAARPAAQAPTVPAATVKFAFYPCCADTSLPLVAIRKGFFSDVGITISPSDGGHYSDPTQTTPAMQRRQYDISSQYIPAYLTALPTFGQTLPASMIYDIYLGDMILQAPEIRTPTTLDYVKRGMPFRAAAAKAVAKLKGQTIYTDPFGAVQPPYFGLFLSYAHLNEKKDVKYTFLSDAKILSLSAIKGRIKYAFPYNAPVLVLMIQNGWRPIIGNQMILQYDAKSSQGKALAKISGGTGLQTQLELQTKHHDTLLRFISAIYRTIAFVSNPRTAAEGDKIVADVINATQGTKLSAKNVDSIYKVIDPLFPWEQQAKTLWNPNSPYYAPSSLRAQLQSLIANGTIKKGNYHLDRFLSAKRIFAEMRASQVKADGLFKKAQSQTLSAEAAATLAKAKQYYKWYDFLDAVRFAQAALQ
jgi:hypothetical protein